MYVPHLPGCEAVQLAWVLLFEILSQSVSLSANSFLWPSQLQAIQLPPFCTSYYTLQHRCLWQWLCPQPKGHNSSGKGLHQWLELWFRACATSTHTTQPVPVSRGELWELPTLPLHRTELLSSPLPTTPISLHGLLMSGPSPPLTASITTV